MGPILLHDHPTTGHTTNASKVEHIGLQSFASSSIFIWASLVAQMVKNPPAVQETRVASLGGEDPLEEEMTTYSSILAWRIPGPEEPGGLPSIGSHRVGHN